MINWKVRIKNKTFWLSVIPAVFLLVQQIAAIFGYQISTADLTEKFIAVVGTVFAILSIVGVVADPTTEGVGDSDQALTYDEPKEKGDGTK